MAKSEPIITSFLDTDFYKLTMGQIAWKYFRDTPVTYALKNRTGTIRLPRYIDEGQLREELDHVRTILREEDELSFLKESTYIPRNFFCDEYIEFLRKLNLLPEYNLGVQNDEFVLEFSGPWSEAIYWETPALAIVTELYSRSAAAKYGLSKADVRHEGMRRFQEKEQTLRHHKLPIVEFGTRRRYARAWQHNLLEYSLAAVPECILGTSNVALAREYNIKPLGTQAHEMFMIFASIYHGSDEEILASHNKVYDVWYKEYGAPLAIALSDTYGSRYAFNTLTLEHAENWRGFRQDSGHPLGFGEDVLRFYKKHKIDAKEKTLLFSDGLDVGTMAFLYSQFSPYINVSFGWGTNFTNDVGIKPISLVIKAVSANGHGTVKLSDNLAKATGTPHDIERFKKIFGYTGKDYEECKY